MRRFPVWLAVGVVASALANPRPALAQGYGVYEHGTCTMGRAGTGVASSCPDGSAIFFNPAGLAFAEQQLVSAGGTLIAPSGGFTDDVFGSKTDLNSRVYPVPHVYYQRRLNDRWVAGFGLFVPYGLETDWPKDFVGRFLGYKSVIQGIYLQPTVAVKLTDRIAVGGGVDITYLKVGLHQFADLSTVPLPAPSPPGFTFASIGITTGTAFANVDLEGHTWNMGANLGIQIQATDKLSFGAKYLSRQKAEINKGRVKFTQVSTGIVLAGGNPLGAPAGTPLDAILAPQFLPGQQLAKQVAATSVTLPEQIALGVAYQFTPRLKILFDYQHVNWEVFDVLVINFAVAGQRTLVENYHASDGYRLGGEYTLGVSTTLRAGVLTHTEAAPDQTVTPNLPEGPRTEFTLGFGTRLGQSLHVDLAYQYIDQSDRRGRTTDGGLSAPTAKTNNGIYTFSAHLFGATLTWAF